MADVIVSANVDTMLRAANNAAIRSAIGLGNVDNTSDANKPISTATQTALDGKAASSHTHAISDTTGLQTALDGKAASSHTHAISDTTGLQTALDGKAASSHTHAISDITNLTTELGYKQDALVNQTNIKSINNVSLLGSGDLSVAKALTITSLSADADVTLSVNCFYHGSIAGYTADRTLTVPAGTAGDTIGIFITTGDDTYEAIIQGATGVSINGGTAATEWSRLFITNEYVQLYCVSTNNWRVVVDRRIPQEANMYLAASVSNHYANDAVTKVPVDTIEANIGDIASLANDNVTMRRNCRVAISGGFFVDGLINNFNQIIAFASVNEVLYRGSWVSKGDSGISGAAAFVSIASVGISAGQSIHIAGYQNDGGARSATAAARNTYLSVRELL